MLSDLLTGTDLSFDQRRFLQQVVANADSWLVKILRPSDCCTFNLEWGTHITLPHTGDQGTLKKTNQDCKSQMMEISATKRCLSDMTCLWHARTLKSCLHRACTIGPKHSILEGERLMGSQPRDIMVITDCLGRGIILSDVAIGELSMSSHPCPFNWHWLDLWVTKQKLREWNGAWNRKCSQKENSREEKGVCLDCSIFMYKDITDKIYKWHLSLIKFIFLLPVLLAFLPEAKLFAQ